MSYITRFNFIRTSLAGLATVAIVFSGVALACTMPAPPPVEEDPEFEWEIEVEFEDYDSVDDLAYYKIEIETALVPPTSSTTCQCGLGLGSAVDLAPASFDVVGAAVGIRGTEDIDLEEFLFSEDSGVGVEISALAGGAVSFGFSAEVEPFTTPTLEDNENLVLAFLIALDPQDYDEVNGSTIQFAAGSTDPGHAVSIFDGYSAILTLPPLAIVPEPSTMTLGMLGLVAVCCSNNRRRLR